MALAEVVPRDFTFDSVDPRVGDDSYVQPHRQANLVKVHGSIDWVRPLPDVPTWMEAAALLEMDRPWEDIRHVDIEGSISGSDYRGRYLYPVITAPLADKQETDLICPPWHIDFLKEFVPTAHKFLFIGTSGMDDDLFKLLGTKMPDLAMVQVVGKGRDRTSGSLAEIKRRIPKIGLYQSLAPQLVQMQTDGFQEYARSEALDTFLTNDVDDVIRAGA